MMKSLKNKASRFFKDSPIQDEKVANAELGADLDFDAEIHGRSMKKKPSRFFLRKNDKTDKPLPAPPSNASSSTLVTPAHAANGNDANNDGQVSQQGVSSSSGVSVSFPSAPTELATSLEPLGALGSARSSVKHGLDPLKVRPRPSFATLRSKGSRFFRNDTLETPSLPPPPPPLPQIPVDPVAQPPRRPSLTPLHSARNSRSSFIGHQSRVVSISRPVPLSQYSNLPIPENPVTVAFIKPSGPPPTRPSRPESLDNDIIAFMQQSGTRMVLTNNNRMSDSTASASTPRSHASSIEARLGLPSGYGTPQTYSLDSPLAARFPLDALQPLQVRDSTGSVRVSAFSQYIKNEQGGYAADGVDEEDRELGPIEQYDATKEGDWKMEKRVSKGPNGNPGMLFRDRWGAFQFVADI